MSYSLGVWYSDHSLSEAEADLVYTQLCEGELLFTGDRPEVETFYRALCELYPEIDRVPRDRLESCPWSSCHDRSGSHVLLSIRPSRSDPVADEVARLAVEHGLTCFDPQTPFVWLPRLARAPRERFAFAAISKTFDEAEEGFKSFLAQRCYPANLLWSVDEEIGYRWARHLVLAGGAERRRIRARESYERGAASSGVSLEAVTCSGGVTICRVFVPEDDDEANSLLIPRNCVKLSAPVQPRPAWLIRIRWLFDLLR